MTRIFIAGLILCLSLLSAQAGSATDSSPQPKLPANGKAEALIDFDYGSGKVTAVHIVKSTGVAKLDKSMVQEFMRWRCRPHTYTRVKVPVTFTVEGAKPKP